MVDTTIRLAPSGPPIENASGGDASLGTGARLRLAEATTTVGTTTNVITTVDQVIGLNLAAAPIFSDGPMTTSLTLPDVNKNYRATLVCDACSALTNARIKITLGIQTSKDGITWTTKVSNDHWLSEGADTDANGFRSMRCDLTLQSGTTLGVVAGDAELAIRGIIRGDAVGAHLAHPLSAAEAGAGSCYIVLEELF